ncbi:hypothetical protein B9Z65_1965 [Elsinoe australis]|uniref:Arrestin-like N-terminal domain-containing protein n=1 Tax=Elsinoe australis TaxID=40998 RepID=A0A2P7YMN5_9PEZI|nr:hypothetical protein B9Z65_1965 [Elsinoe australis]
MTVGRVLHGIDGDQYAQPQIEYRIHAVIKSTSDSGSDSTVAQTDEEVTIMPCSEPSPPIDTDDFPGEFIQSVTYPFRTSYLGPRYQMTLSLPEPTPMFTCTVLDSTTNLRLRIEVDISTEKGGRDLASLSKVLESLRFKARFALRAKTFYATRPFSQMPGYTMANTHGLPNIHDSASETHTVDISSSCWRPHFHSDASHPNDVTASSSNFDLQTAGTDIISPSDSVPSIKQWSTTLEVLLPVEGALIPTFCSAIASRQYSIVARIKVKGGPLKEFLLEMPVQNHCSPPPNALQSTGNTQTDWSGRNGSGTRSGASEPASDVLDADVL